MNGHSEKYGWRQTGKTHWLVLAIADRLQTTDTPVILMSTHGKRAASDVVTMLVSELRHRQIDIATFETYMRRVKVSGLITSDPLRGYKNATVAIDEADNLSLRETLEMLDFSRDNYVLWNGRP